MGFYLVLRDSDDDRQFFSCGVYVKYDVIVKVYIKVGIYIKIERKWRDLQRELERKEYL